MTLGWEERSDGLHRRFEFKNFNQAWEFMSKVAVLAESQDHHPDWSNSYNVVEIMLCSHDSGRTVTNRDLRLAKSINEMLGEPHG
ncbi:MAG: 4a-hydroxytetrahydrobiopterin dehydratase [Acidimicrobiia bacterium]